MTSSQQQIGGRHLDGGLLASGIAVENTQFAVLLYGNPS